MIIPPNIRRDQLHQTVQPILLRCSQKARRGHFLTKRLLRLSLLYLVANSVSLSAHLVVFDNLKPTAFVFCGDCLWLLGMVQVVRSAFINNTEISTDIIYTQGLIYESPLHDH